VRTFAALALVACAFGLAIYAFQRPTIARGDVIAGDLLALYGARGWRSIACERDIPIGVRGAQFSCEVELDDGAVATLAFVFDRDGRYDYCVVHEARARHHRVLALGEVWCD
jgi:hypothetical protein